MNPVVSYNTVIEDYMLYNVNLALDMDIDYYFLSAIALDTLLDNHE